MQIDVLHVVAGHSTLTFDTSNPESVQRAEKQINDMLRQGYTIFVEKDGATNRITSFDAANGVYKIGDKEIPAEGSKATTVAPTAGGCLSL